MTLAIWGVAFTNCLKRRGDALLCGRQYFQDKAVTLPAFDQGFARHSTDSANLQRMGRPSVRPEEVMVGETIVVKPERVPLDGKF